MASSKNILNDIKKDLARSRPKERNLTGKRIVEELAEDIHTQLKAGARLDDVYEIIRRKLPDETKLTLTTFKRYWREARDAAGLPRIKNSGRRKAAPPREEAPASISSGAPQKAQEPITRTGSRDTSGDFRPDPDDI